jgi:medium-chain acyl-[acyl-carrier-protein] hydrolase
MSTLARWASCSRPLQHAALRLFCFPYAGGGSAIFRDWAHALAPAIEVWAVQLPGRERRIAEPPIASIDGLVDALHEGLGMGLAGRYAFFGHSMGALLCFELARRLRQLGRDGPARLIVSGYRAPHLPDERPPIGELPLPAFVDELRRMNGTPAGVLEHDELLALVLPALRADFCAVEGYRYRPQPPIACPVFACGGRNDSDISGDDLSAWREHTAGAFGLQVFDGDHFYLHSQRDALCATLLEQLTAGFPA